MQTMLNALGAELAALPEVGQVAAALAAPAACVRVAPLAAAARVPVLAALARRAPAPLLVVTTSADAAQRLIDDLRQWLDPAAVRLYPASDAQPYEHMSPGPQALAARLAALTLLAEYRAAPDVPALVLVAPVKALLQPTLSPAELAEASWTLRRGQQVRPDQLMRHMLDQGYRRVPAVEQPGELVRRGDLLDLWPAADELPLRIEFFGDEIDNLRRFDPTTQRSAGRVTTATVGPAHEIPLWRREHAVARIAEIDITELRAEARSEWEAALEQLTAGERFEGRAFYAPFFRVGPAATLLDHLPKGAALLITEAQFVAQHAAEIHVHAESQRERLVDAGELPAHFPRPYLLWDDVVRLEPSGEPAHDPARAYAVANLTHNEGADQVNPPAFGVAELFGGQLRRLVQAMVAQLQQGQRVLAVTSQAARLQELVSEALAADAATAPIVQTRFAVQHGALDGGWQLPALGLNLYTDVEIFGLRQRRSLSERRKRGLSTDERAAFVRGLKLGDYVVHIEHGIAVYDGLIRRVVGEIEREYLVLRYAASDKIYVPVDQVDRVTRYVGAGDSAPTLTRLGTQDWERAKRKARAAVQDLAEELLKLYAQRQTRQGHAFAPDNEWQRELEAAFPFLETDDQLRAIDDVKADMEQRVPMDRLVCGDVGFGKTEVALRAAFKAVQDGRQVAVLVPTTVLAQQHYDTFMRRMTAFPIMVQMLSRFRSPKAQSEILTQLAQGRVDILIGTHRLLSKDVHFKDLGLVVVDEEQRFGVRHKERLKQLRAEVDVLTLTATPIPRTLHMAMAGIRDLSVIDTPPEDRVPIKTYVLPYSENLVREAILRELERDGQVYFVHNRVHSIYHIASRLRALVPEAQIGVGHGQLGERELEKVMLDFFEGRHDVLVCTTIIESGLDVPNANTIIIDDATNYGLAQLYQLRGRVGRSANRAYAYLLYRQDKPMTLEAQARLEAIQEATELGAGFRVAMRDLEIRGAGNLLGAEQSGHIAAVGFDLYTRLLEQAVRQLKQQVDARHAAITAALDAGEPAPPTTLDEPDEPIANKLIINEKILVSPLVTLDLPLTAYLPTNYISDERVRLDVYLRMVEAQTTQEVRELRQELEDRFGPPPEEALHLLTWLTIKALALQAGVSSVVTVGDEFVLRLPILEGASKDRLRRRYGRDPTMKLGPQFVRLQRPALGADWPAKLIGLLEVLGSG